GQNWRGKRVSGIVAEPVTDGGALAVAGVEFEDFEVVRPGGRGTMKLLGIEARQHKMGGGEMAGGFVGVHHQQALEFLGGVREIATAFEGEGEIVAGIEGIGLDREGGFVGVKRQLKITGGIGGKAEVGLSLEEGGIGLDGGAVKGDGIGVIPVALDLERLSEETLRFSAIAG